MVAPIDAKSVIEVEGDAYTLRLNFRTIALAEREGVDAFSPDDFSITKLAVLLRSFATPDHPELTDEEAFAMVIRHQAAVTEALGNLYSQVKGAGDAATGNRPKAARRKS